MFRIFGFGSLNSEALAGLIEPVDISLGPWADVKMSRGIKGLGGVLWSDLCGTASDFCPRDSQTLVEYQFRT